MTEVYEAERKLGREIQLIDWLTAGNLSNQSSGVQFVLVLCVICTLRNAVG